MTETLECLPTLVPEETALPEASKAASEAVDSGVAEDAECGADGKEVTYETNDGTDGDADGGDPGDRATGERASATASVDPPDPADAAADATSGGSDGDALSRTEAGAADGGGGLSGRSGLRAELSELGTLFPEVKLSEIPAEVWESGLPLAAAYAVYARRCARLIETAECENRKNAERSTGGLQPGDDPFYTPEEVRRMTRSEVRDHFDGILRSMKRWK